MLNFLEAFANKIVNLNKKLENIKSKKPEILVLVLYCALHIIISIFHEPWFDEAVAWQIAKVANIKDILFEIPHYEGHPPLWHLVLVPFAKLGAPYEFSLSFVSLIFTGLTMYLILFKSPFPRLIKLLLPFNYFMFYQYGVISRPYCMMMLAFALLAILYKKHNEKPFLYGLGLVFLCLTSAYGIVFAGGIAIAWIIEMICEKGFNDFIKKIFNDKRVYALGILLIFAVCLIWLIIPRLDTYAIVNTEDIDKVNICIRFIYMFILIFADLTLLDIFNYNSASLITLKTEFNTFIGGALIGGLILYGVICFAKKKKKAILFLVPYFLFGIFSSIVYFSPHHIGVLQLFLIFLFWVALEESQVVKLFDKVDSNDKKIILNFSIFCSTICFISTIGWSMTIGVGEILYDYSVGRNEAEFIVNNKLINYNIISDWQIDYDKAGEKILSMQTNMFGKYICLAPYFDNNIVYNFNNGENDKNYIDHKALSEIQNVENIERWRKKGYPDVILGNVRLDLIFDKDELSYDDYSLVYICRHKKMWKIPNRSSYIVPIFIRNDLLKQFELEIIDKLLLPDNWHSMYN